MAAANTPTPSAPSAIDVEKLLAPVSEDNPVGQDLRRLATQGAKSILLDDIEQRRRAIVDGTNENLEQGAQTDPTMAAQQRRGEWREIERMLVPAFSKGKELGAAVMLVVAAASGRGWATLGPGFRLLRLLQERYWDTLYPLADEDDPENPYADRLASLNRLDHERYLPLAIHQIPLTDPKAGGEYGWADFKQLEKFRTEKLSKDEDAESRRALVEDRAKAEGAAERGSLAFYNGLIQAIDEGSAELIALREFIHEKYEAPPGDEDERPSFRNIETAIEEARVIAARYWKKKGGGAPTPEEAAAAQDAGGGGTEGGSIALGGTTDVVGLLERALAHLKNHQRHNPAAFLVEEAIRWTKMPISEWYLEATADPNLSGFVSKLMGGNKTPEGGS